MTSEQEGWQALCAAHWFVFLDGASASGKSTIKNRLLADADFGFAYAKRYTTRAPRHDDIVNDDYVFVSATDFRRMRDSGDLIEHRDFLFGMSYGIGKSALQDAASKSSNVLAVMNLGSVQSIKSAIPASLCILIDAPLDVIERRLRRRGLNSEEQVQERLQNAAAAKLISHQYDYVLHNAEDKLEESYAALKKYLQEKRMHRMPR